MKIQRGVEMKKFRARMFNRRASRSRSMSSEIIEKICPSKGQMIADIGAGGGYFTWEFSEKVGPEGEVFPVDIEPAYLDSIIEGGKKRGLTNIKAVRGNVVFEKLPLNTLDIVFIRNAYHHLPDRISYFRKLKRHLKKQGKVIVIDYQDDGGFSFHSLFGHNVPIETIIEEMKEAGYLLKRSYGFLLEQCFLIFEPTWKDHCVDRMRGA